MPTATPRNQWRTVLVLAFLSIVLLIALGLCLRAGELGVKLFPDVSHVVIVFGLAAAGRSALQHGADAMAVMKRVIAPEAKP